MDILKIYKKDQLQTKYYEIKYLIILKIQNVMDIKEVLLLWFMNFLIKSPQVVVLKTNLNKMNKYLKNHTHQLLENFKNEKYINLLKTIFGVLIFQICN